MIDKPYPLLQLVPGLAKKRVLSSDRFLVKLQLYALDVGLFSYLLNELQARHTVPTENHCKRCNRPYAVWVMLLPICQQRE